MGYDEKVEAEVDQAKGAIKEKVGDATDNRDLQAEGKADQVKGDLREGWEKTKDAVKDATN